MRVMLWRFIFVALSVPHAALDRARTYAFNKLWSLPEWKKEYNDRIERDKVELGLTHSKPPPKRLF